jgi:hypothetical protein
MGIKVNTNNNNNNKNKQQFFQISSKLDKIKIILPQHFSHNRIISNQIDFLDLMQLAIIILF